MRDDQDDDIIDVEDEDLYAPPDSKYKSAKLHDLPKLKDEKPMIGPTSADGNIKVHYKSQIDGYEIGQEDMKMMADMERMGLPTGFSFGNLQYEAPAPSHLRTKKQKKTFWCQTCKLELNSEDTLISHMKGQKHMKKQLAQTSDQSIPAIVPIPNPIGRKKLPLRLHEKIQQNTQKIVGLAFVKEFIACSNSEMEPHYECGLCETQGMSNCMFQHLVGRDHRQKFVEQLYPNDPSKLSLTQSELLRYAEEHDEKEDPESRILTKRSDDEYPWPSGTEPWLIENGGSGIIPDGARTNFGKTKPTPPPVLPSPMISAAAIKADVKPNLQMISEKYKIPEPAALIPPKTHQDAMRMFSIGKKLLLAGSKAIGRINPECVNLLQATVSSIELKMLKSSSDARSSSTYSGRSTSSGSSSASVARPGSGSSHRSWTPSTSNSSRDLSSDSDGRGYREDYNYNHKRRRSQEHSQERDSYKRRSPEDYSRRRDSRRDDYRGSSRSRDYY